MFYTRKGDDGTSGLFGNAERHEKTSLVFEALGTVDELNALLGVVYAQVREREADTSELSNTIRRIQEDLFIVQAELAGAGKTLTPDHLARIETEIEVFGRTVRNPHAFIVPGSTLLSAQFDHARTVARRTERAVLRAGETNEISHDTRSYMNRLSSLLYVLARYAAHLEGVEESNPSY